MKKSLKLLFCATALASLAGCNKFDEADTAPDSGNGSLIKVYAKVAENDGTRANIHVGESAFTAEWEAGDALGILPVKTGGTAPASAAKFDYNATSAAFEGSLNDFAAGGGNYYAFFPHAKVTGTTAKLPFGNLRTQAGNDFNSAYDALVATPRAYTADDEAGKADGKDVTFTLHRLTSILNFSIATPADKVKYLLLTAGGETQKLSAASLDFALENGGAGTVPALSTADQSNVIALQYTPAAGTADKVEAFFNVPAGNYDNLTLDVITSDNQIGSVSVQRSDVSKPFVAGTLYKKEVSDLAFSAIAAPSLVWPGEDMDEPHDITKCGTDYEANIQITVPGGIAGLIVNITSSVLNEMGLTELDLFNNDLGLPGMTSGVAIQYQKSTTFNITELVPLIASLNAAPGSEHVFEVVVTDLAGQQTTQKLTFFMPSPITYNKDADLWLNTASFALKDIPADATSVSVQYKKSTETTWQDAEVSDDKTKATIAPVWEAATTTPDWYTPNTVQSFQRIKEGTGIFANNTYDYKLSVDGTEYTGQFTTSTTQTIPDGNMDNSNLPCFTTSESATSAFWGSGNNSTTKNLCQPKDWQNGYRAKCQSAKAPVVSILAAGNLFTGTFRMASTYTGEVSFGQQYEWQARPTALKVSYHATVGTVDRTDGESTKIAQNNQDKARIFFCIVDWTSRHIVSSTPYINALGGFISSTAKTTGAWDPETVNSTDEGKIIGYGSMWIDTNTSGDEMATAIIKTNFYDTTAVPTAGNYSLVISCACNAYGDYFNGCSGNTLYVDDFEWVY